MDQELLDTERARGLLPETVLSSIRRLVVAGVVTAVVYTFVLTASRAQCFGDPATPQTCVSLQLRPSTFFLIGIAAVAVGILLHVLSRVSDTARAERLLERAVTGIVIGGVVAVVAGHSLFWSIPADAFDADGYFFVNPLFLLADIRIDVQQQLFTG